MSTLSHRAKNVAKNVSPLAILKRGSQRKVFNAFAEKYGFVYFGYVDQRDDEHHLLRGVTSSSSHDDRHYTVGTFETYDIAVAVRKDSIDYGDKRIKSHVWTIMTFDLHTTEEIPHIFMANHQIRDVLLAKFTRLSPFVTQTSSSESGYKSEYTLYGQAEKYAETQFYASEPLLAWITEHFDGLSVEIIENTLYMIATEANPNLGRLEQILKNGLWLASYIDTAARSFQQMSQQR